jgi:hypothetical protein
LAAITGVRRHRMRMAMTPARGRTLHKGTLNTGKAGHTRVRG